MLKMNEESNKEEGASGRDQQIINNNSDSAGDGVVEVAVEILGDPSVTPGRTFQFGGRLPAFARGPQRSIAQGGCLLVSLSCGNLTDRAFVPQTQTLTAVDRLSYLVDCL